MNFSRLFLLASLLWLAAPAEASPPVPEPSSRPSIAGPPMRVMLVRGAYPGCEPNCEEWIYAEGQIGTESLALFRAAMDAVRPRKPPILIHSGGGEVFTAMAIGRLIRSRGFDVAVARTEFPLAAQPSAAASEPAAQENAQEKKNAQEREREREKEKGQGKRKGKGKAEPPKARGIARGWRAACASACTLVLAAGARRYVGPTAFVGVHEIVRPEQTIMQKMRYYQIRTLREGNRIVSQEKVMVRETSAPLRLERAKASPETYRSVRSYLVEMGATREVVDLMMTAPPESIRWLTRAELASTRLASEERGGETLVAYTPPARAPTPWTPPPAAQITPLAAPPAPTTSGPATPQPVEPIAAAEARRRIFAPPVRPSWFDLNRGWIVLFGLAAAPLLWAILASLARTFRGFPTAQRRDPILPPTAPSSD
ncbi:hypothetical protein [Methylosinus sp. Ce-a6]|uniref:COG3904 family protein n=1 Tax=Methylosinus sp. Ce-a6 TaxID=2172005 RepID=UPI00135ABA16|nr:hypothetical protein [Methylosinus sp. Ce-a6]